MVEKSGEWNVERSPGRHLEDFFLSPSRRREKLYREVEQELQSIGGDFLATNTRIEMINRLIGIEKESGDYRLPPFQQFFTLKGFVFPINEAFPK